MSAGSTRRLLKEHKSLLLFISLMLLFRSAIADWNVVPSGSMQPTIKEGDYIWIDKLAYDVRVPFTSTSVHTYAHPQRGDIIVFESAKAGKRLVKRVVGLPGDVVSLRANKLTINGHKLEYAHTGTDTELIEKLFEHRNQVRLSATPSAYANFGAVSVPTNMYLALGDNRDQSADSRVIGFVPRSEILGRAERVLMSFDVDNYLIPRWKRFGQPLDCPD